VVTGLGGAAPGDRLLRVMAVDDSPANLMVLASFLKREGLEVRTVDNGADALSSYQTFAPDLVFMDLSMPETDGFAAAACIRAHEVRFGLARVPIIALTAFEFDDGLASRVAISMDDHLSKPVRKQDILRMLELWRRPPHPSPLGDQTF
jgi:CheY-like chemotaxis protein